MTSSPSVGNMPSAVFPYKFSGFFSVSLILVVLLKDFFLQNRCVPFLKPCLLSLLLNSSLIAVGNNLPFYSILEFLPGKVQNALHLFSLSFYGVLLWTKYTAVF